MIWVLVVPVVLQVVSNWRDIRLLQDEIRSIRTGLAGLERRDYE